MVAALAIPALWPSSGAAEGFSAAKLVSNKDLDKMRGGFIDINGQLLSFGYSAVTSINGVVRSSVSFNDVQLTQAIVAGKNLQIPPTILQNATNNVQIALQQQLNLTVIGANLRASVALANAFTNARSFH